MSPGRGSERCGPRAGGRLALGALLSAVLALAGCETRDRDNPFDPENPATHGEPSAVAALASDAGVRLSWDLSGFDDVAQISLERETSGGPPVIIEPFVAASGERDDLDVANGTTYAYRLVVFTQSGDRLETREDLATPGGSIVWMGDAAGFGLARLSPDGRDLAYRLEQGRAFLDLSVDLAGGVWAADFFGGEILHYDADGTALGTIDLPGVSAVAYDGPSGQVWAGSFTLRSVSRFSIAGGGLTLRIDDLGQVEDVETERFPLSGLWVATRENGVARISNDTVARRWSEFVWPVSLNRDPAGWVWVLDRGTRRAARIFVGSGEVFSSDVVFGDPRDASLDGEGGLYVADSGRGGIVHLSADGAEVGFWPEPGASGVTWDPVGERLWVVKRETGEVVRVDRSGASETRVAPRGSPVKVEGFWRR